MKINWMVLGIALTAFTACEKSAQPTGVAATDAGGTPIAKEPSFKDLSAEKERLKHEIDLEMGQVKALQREIADYKQTTAELKRNLASASAVKKEMLADTGKLKARWPRELQGFGEGPPASLIETFREDSDEIGKLSEENSELKKRLAEKGN